MSGEAQELLRQRVKELDGGPPPSSGADLRLEHVVSVLEQYTDTYIGEVVGGPAVLEVGHADRIVGASTLLAGLDAVVPALMRGPVDQEAQVWVGTARHCGRPPSSDRLTTAASGPVSVTPWSGTLYTSSASPLGPSMWFTYLDLYRGSDLYPLPWHVWAVPAAGRVLEITNARDWVTLINRHPRHVEDVIYPAWDSIAADYDGVHLSLRAVITLQGFSFASAHGLTAPGYWDAETTHWLRWAFRTPRLIKVIPDT